VKTGLRKEIEEDHQHLETDQTVQTPKLIEREELTRKSPQRSKEKLL
jgi:hypothetical protein